MKPRSCPLLPDTTISERPVGSPTIESSTKTPSPAGIIAPVKLNASTIFEPVDIVKPTLAASPPDAEKLPISPSIVNWKPAISSLLSYIIL